MKFLKMHGLGNDFVILDHRNDVPALAKNQIQLLADRHFGVGCDQVIVMEPSEKADLFMRIYNPDASEAEACGNATRCVAHLYMNETGADSCTVETVAALLPCTMKDDGLVQVDMGQPQLDWHDIGLAEEVDTLHLPIATDEVSDPVAVGVGNPHCVFFIENVVGVDLRAIGPALETHRLYPARTNVEFVEVQDGKLRTRVWERGAGITLACGSGACAAAVAAMRRELCPREVEVVMDGGTLTLEWREEDDHILMTGPVAYVFEGELRV